MKKLGFFVLKFLAVFMIILFTADSSGIKKAYQSFYMSVSEFLFDEMAVDGKVYFQPYEIENQREYDIEVGLLSDRYINRLQKESRKNKKGKKKKTEIRPFSSKYNSTAMGLLPSVFIFSLVIAASLPIKRSIFSLLISLFLFHVISFCVFKLCLLNDFQTTSEIIQYEKGSFMDSSIRFGFKHFPTRLDILFALAFIIWIVSSFKKEDINKLKWNKEK